MRYAMWLFAMLLGAIAYGAGCESAVGEWKWFNGGNVTLQQNQTIVVGGKLAGKWECTNPARAVLTMRWNAGFIDVMTVAGDRISGKNQHGAIVSGTRINKPKGK